MAFSKRAQAGKIVNRPTGGGTSKSGIPSSIGRSRQIVFKLKSRSYASPSRKAINGNLLDGPISGATVTLKAMNGIVLGITTSNSVGEFSFSSDLLQPNTYYLIESSSGTDTITNLQIIVGLTLLLKTDPAGNANIVVSPVSTVLQEMIASDVNSLNSLTTAQIDALVSQNKTSLAEYLSTGSANIANIETTNFLKTGNVDLYKENASIYSYLTTTYEIEQNTYDERNPITELVSTLSSVNQFNLPSISGLLTSANAGFTKYTDNLTINTNDQTVSDLISNLSNSNNITSVNNVLQTAYQSVEYPKQYDLQLIKDISGFVSYGVTIDSTGQFVAYSNGANGGFIRDLSNDTVVLNIVNPSGSELGFDMTGNDQFIVAGSRLSSAGSQYNQKGHVQIYKRIQSPPYWALMTAISGETIKDSFGGSGLSIYNNELMVASFQRSYSDVSGQVQIFSLNASNDTFTKIFDISGDIPRSSLGANNGCSIYENYAAIGSYNSGYLVKNSPIKCGKVIVLKKVGGNWTRMVDVYPPEKYVIGEKGHYNNDGTMKDPSGLNMVFGFSVGITNTHLAIGGYFYSDMSGNTVLKSRCGAVFLYELSGNSWEYVTTFLGDDIRGNYGYDIQLSTDFLVVGALNTNSNIVGNKYCGAVYIYEKGPYGTWGFKNKLNHPMLGGTTGSNKTFGYKVDLKENNLVVTDGGNSVYVYKKTEVT